jgi:beta-lactam-binding protein with PASTA domain
VNGAAQSKHVLNTPYNLGRVVGALLVFAGVCLFVYFKLVVSVPKVQGENGYAALDVFKSRGKGLNVIPAEKEEIPKFKGEPLNVESHMPPYWRTIRGAVITLRFKEPEGGTVPNVVGMHEFEAKIRLEAEGFKNVVARKNWCPAEPEGTVISQQPEPDEKCSPEEEITICVSAGTDLYNVPRVIDKSVKEAKETLEGAGFIGRDLEANPPEDYKNVKPGTVFDQYPAPKDRAYRGCEVALKVTPKETLEKGRLEKGEEKPPPVTATPKEELVRVPSVSGKSEREATTTLKEAEFKVNVERRANDRVTAGKVIKQTPSGYVAPRTTVTIIVSSGREPTPEFTFCRKCGRSIPAGVEICPRCGRPPR